MYYKRHSGRTNVLCVLFAWLRHWVLLGCCFQEALPIPQSHVPPS
jgi:hypothetical protein